MSATPERGWGYIKNSPKWHYFDRVTARSACGKWMQLGPMNDLEDSNDGSPDNCKECQRRVKTMRERAAAQGAQS